METFAQVVFAIIGIIGLGAFSCNMGANYVHAEWKRDAITRCEKVQTKEWCEGRAVLEKW